MQTPPPLKGEPVPRHRLFCRDDGGGAEAIGIFQARGRGGLCLREFEQAGTRLLNMTGIGGEKFDNRARSPRRFITGEGLPHASTACKKAWTGAGRKSK